MSEVDHFGALGLQEPPHDVDGGVVPVEQAGGGHEPDRIGRLVELVLVVHRPDSPFTGMAGTAMFHKITTTSY